MRVKVCGKTWNLFFRPCNDKERGWCKIESREMVVDDRCRPKTMLRVLLHELLHASDWTKDEEWVDEVSTDIANILWRLGYRKVENP